MRVVCAPDSFKESMSAAEAAAAMARGVRTVVPDAEVLEIPLSDGGEGFLDSLTAALDATTVAVAVHDALGRPVTARFGLTRDGTAIIEMAEAAGLEQIARTDRDVWRASTIGVGELIAAALDRGATHVLLGIGGSATNDGGAGMLAALGLRYLDSRGELLQPTPASLRNVHAIDGSSLDPRLQRTTIEVACDVTNPLSGQDGASAIFGPQKGATRDDIPALDALLAHLARLGDGEQHAHQPGAGAAGGLGYALVHDLGAELRPGLDLVSDAVHLPQAIRDADLVLTGEGSVDAQTLNGKTPAGVTAIAAEHGVPTIVLAGRVAPDAEVLIGHGVTALVPILPEVMDLPSALETGAANLERAAAMTLRLTMLRTGSGR